MKKNRRWCFLLMLLMLWNCCCVSAVAETGSCITLDAEEALAGKDQLLPTAQAAVLYAPGSDTMVYSWNPDTPLDPSGMNKIMTALLALENGNLDAAVTVTTGALGSVEVGAMSAGLKSGETMTLRDLLYLMMVGSANDAAAVIAEHIAGSEAAFIAKMNERATELGCNNTVFLNSTGLSVEGQYTTARDLAKITAEALKLEEFVTIFSAVEYTVPNSERKAVTTNYMMTQEEHFDSRITGGKTGALSTTVRSLISTAEMDGQRYLVVLMNAKGTLNADGTSVRTFGNFAETQLLLDHAFSRYTERQLLSADQVMAQFKVDGGENDLAVAARQAVSALMPKGMNVDHVTYQCVALGGSISAPVQEGDIVGTVQLWYDNLCVAQGDLVAMHGVKVKGTAATALQPEAELGNGVLEAVALVCLFVFLGAIVHLVVIVFGIRFIQSVQHRKNRKPTRRRG